MTSCIVAGTLADAHLERIFLFAVMWSLGCVLELDDRSKMEEFVLTHPSKCKWPKPQVSLKKSRLTL